MTPTSAAAERIRSFVGEVADHFDDLPGDDREELLDDLENHLLELAAEDPASLEQELVDPAAYAVELRHSAGFPPAPTGGRPPRHQRVVAAVGARVERVLAHRMVRPVVEFLPQLRPAWWVVRGWTAVAVAAIALGGGPWWRHVPVPGRSLLGLLVTAAVVAGSVALGREGRDRTAAFRLLDAAAALAVLVMFFQAATARAPVAYVEVPQEISHPQVLRHPDGEPITNLHLFDRDGNPVGGVYVYDGAGRPVEVGDLQQAGFADIDTVYPRDRTGAPITNRYPLEQYLVEPGGSEVPARTPRPAPDVTVAPRDTEAGEIPSPQGSGSPAPPHEATSTPSPPPSPPPT